MHPHKAGRANTHARTCAHAHTHLANDAFQDVAALTANGWFGIVVQAKLVAILVGFDLLAFANRFGRLGELKARRLR